MAAAVMQPEIGKSALAIADSQNSFADPGVTTWVSVSTTIRGEAEHNDRMMLAKDAEAEVNYDTHAAEMNTMAGVFATMKTTDEIVAMRAAAALTR
jgi:hypothetical protein